MADDSSQTKKLIVVGVLFVAVGLLLLYQFTDIFGAKGPAYEPPSDEIQNAPIPEADEDGNLPEAFEDLEDPIRGGPPTEG